jgi:hypothetical protein
LYYLLIPGKSAQNFRPKGTAIIDFMGIMGPTYSVKSLLYQALDFSLPGPPHLREQEKSGEGKSF